MVPSPHLAPVLADESSGSLQQGACALGHLDPHRLPRALGGGEGGLASTCRLEAMVTVLPSRRYRGTLLPTTPALAGPLSMPILSRSLGVVMLNSC